MTLLNKLEAIEYIYENVGNSMFLYRKSNASEYQLLNESENTSLVFPNSKELYNYLLSNQHIDYFKVEVLVDIILTEQALYHKIMMEKELKLLGMSVADLNIMEAELKGALQDITSKYMRTKLEIVK